MEPNLFQSTVLAIVQGLTEFLPISSSAHLILPSQVFGWPDQGLAFDVAVHLGSLTAVLLYFHKDLWQLFIAWLYSLLALARTRPQQSGRIPDAAKSGTATGENHGKLAWYLLFASVPAALAGFFAEDWISVYARNANIIAVTSILFGLLLWWADRRIKRIDTLLNLSLKQAMIIGLAQALALIPGTSRSGITMTAALLLGFSREAAARFSFLLAVPIIAGSGTLQAVKLIAQGVSAQEWFLLGYGAVVSAIVAFLCIHYFLRLITRVGYLPFVVYRVLLGVVLLLIGVY